MTLDLQNCSNIDTSQKSGFNIFREANCSFELMHTVSTYPMNDSVANLNLINTFIRFETSLTVTTRSKLPSSSFIAYLFIQVVAANSSPLK